LFRNRFLSRYRPSSFDTGVFFLQSRQGGIKWPATQDVVDNVKQAFRKAVPEGIASISDWEAVMKRGRGVAASGERSQGGAARGRGKPGNPPTTASASAAAATAAGEGAAQKNARGNNFGARPLAEILDEVKAQWLACTPAEKTACAGSFRKFKKARLAAFK